MKTRRFCPHYKRNNLPKFVFRIVQPFGDGEIRFSIASIKEFARGPLAIRDMRRF